MKKKKVCGTTLLDPSYRCYQPRSERRGGRLPRE